MDLQLFSRQHRLHLMFTDHYVRFIVTGKNNLILKFGQKCLPKGVLRGGLIEDAPTLRTLLEQFLYENKIRRMPTYLCLSDGHTIVRKVLVPEEVPTEEIKGYLYMSVGESLHLPFEDPLIEAVEWKAGQDHREVLMISSRESVVQQYVNLLKKIKLKPVVMDLSILSLYRLYYHLDLASRDEHLLVVQIQLAYIQLSIFYEHKPLYVHQIHFTDQFELEFQSSRYTYENWAMKEDSQVKTGQIQQIEREIDRIRNFYQFNLTNGQYEINKLLIAGEHPYISQYVEQLKEHSTIKVQPLTDSLFQTKKNINIPPVFSECIGLTLK
ncbi:pilus assembly protein PilM [Bacillus sp. APMAM]|nr:pilus assembly protein PilM [Bacillus sp. APMAM]RTZ56079.1 hypothetical protein EKO25_09390 [Bacillus sp. SAJ1]